MPYNTQESLLIKRAKVNKNTQEDSLIQYERRPITLKGKKGKEHLGISQEKGEAGRRKKKNSWPAAASTYSIPLDLVNHRVPAQKFTKLGHLLNVVIY